MKISRDNSKDQEHSLVESLPYFASSTATPKFEVFSVGVSRSPLSLSRNTIREGLGFSSSVTVWSGPRLYSWIPMGSPLGSTSSSTRKPSGPRATLVETPKAMCCWGGLGDFLGFLLEEWLIRVIVVRARGQSGGPTGPNPLVGNTVIQPRASTAV